MDEQENNISDTLEDLFRNNLKRSKIMNLIKNDIVKIKDLLNVNLPPKMIEFSGRIENVTLSAT